MSGRQESQNRALLIFSFSILYNVTNNSENSYRSQYTLQKNKLNILILSYLYFPVLIVTKAKRKVTIIDISAVIHSAFTLSNLRNVKIIEGRGARGLGPFMSARHRN